MEYAFTKQVDIFQMIPGPPDLKESLLLLPDPVSPVATSTRLLFLPSQSHPPPTLFSPDHFLSTFRKSFYSSCHLTASAHFRSSLQDWHLLPFSHRAPVHIRFWGDGSKGMPAHTHPVHVTSLVLLHSTPSAVRCHLRAPRLRHSAPRESPHQPSRASSHPCCTLQPRGHLVPVPGDLQDSNVTDPEWGPGIQAFVEHIPTGNQS